MTSRARTRRPVAGISIAAVVALVACGATGDAVDERSTAPAADVVRGGATATETAVRLTRRGPTVAGCSVFPPDNAWNTDVSAAPLHPQSDAIIATIRSVGGDFIHPDFGGRGEYGIPITVVPPDQHAVPIVYEAYGDESDPGPFPVPGDAAVEGGPQSDGDRHVVVVRQGECVLYELFRAFPGSGGAWHADSGARWDLASNATRPLGWTSADAAGLPIMPGLVRYDEVASGVVAHAFRVTFARTQRGYVLPATHFASNDTNPLLPPMGLRLRLEASYDLSSFTGQARVIAEAMRRYGLIVADNGSNWFVQGETHLGWDDTDLRRLKAIPGDAFEVVDTGPVRR